MRADMPKVVLLDYIHFLYLLLVSTTDLSPCAIFQEQNIGARYFRYHVVTRMSKPHVLIIGGGITGLLLAQTLRKNKVSFSIFERDAHETSRNPGWGLAIHWAKQDLISLLPIELQNRLLEANVDPDAAQGRFPFFDLRDGQERYTIPSSERVRLSRGKWRNLMMEGLTVHV